MPARWLLLALTAILVGSGCATSFDVGSTDAVRAQASPAADAPTPPASTSDDNGAQAAPTEEPDPAAPTPAGVPDADFDAVALAAATDVYRTFLEVPLAGVSDATRGCIVGELSLEPRVLAALADPGAEGSLGESMRVQLAGLVAGCIQPIELAPLVTPHLGVADPGEPVLLGCVVFHLGQLDRRAAAVDAVLRAGAPDGAGQAASIDIIVETAERCVTDAVDAADPNESPPATPVPTPTAPPAPTPTPAPGPQLDAGREWLLEAFGVAGPHDDACLDAFFADPLVAAELAGTGLPDPKSQDLSDAEMAILNEVIDCVDYGLVVATEAFASGAVLSQTTVNCVNEKLESSGLVVFVDGGLNDQLQIEIILDCLTDEEFDQLAS